MRGGEQRLVAAFYAAPGCAHAADRFMQLAALCRKDRANGVLEFPRAAMPVRGVATCGFND
jgi:hypothetical protein